MTTAHFTLPALALIGVIGLFLPQLFVYGPLALLTAFAVGVGWLTYEPAARREATRQFYAA